MVASVSEECRKLAWDYISRFPAEHCFETPNLHVLNDALEQKNLRVCFMDIFQVLPCPYPTKLLCQKDFAPLYTDVWSNALCEKRKELDVLGVGAYDGDTLIGFAACSADCASTGLPPSGNCLGSHQPTGGGNSQGGKGSLLLRRVVQCPLSAQRHQKRFPPRMGGAGSEKPGSCG